MTGRDNDVTLKQVFILETLQLGPIHLPLYARQERLLAIVSRKAK